MRSPIALNRGWEEGIASSIRVAVNSAPPGSAALLLMLADQVAVTADDLRRLHASWKRHPILIAAALYQGAPGLPAIFPRWAFTDLLSLRGERDARSVLRRNIDRVVRVPMSNAGIDLDTPDDLLQIDAARTQRRTGPGLSYYVKLTRQALRGMSWFRRVLREACPQGPILALQQPLYFVESSACPAAVSCR